MRDSSGLMSITVALVLNQAQGIQGAYLRSADAAPESHRDSLTGGITNPTRSRCRFTHGLRAVTLLRMLLPKRARRRIL